MALGLIGLEAEQFTRAKPRPPLRLTESELSALKVKLLTNYAEHDGGYATPCWMWLRGWSGGPNHLDYGHLWWNGRQYQAHRASWPIPGALDLLISSLALTEKMSKT